MTLKEKYLAVLADLLVERASHGVRWAYYYDHHISQLQAAIKERWPEESNVVENHNTPSE